MGFSEIYLLGVDFDYTPTVGHRNAHFCDEYTQKEESVGLVDLANIDKVFNYQNALYEFEVAKKVAGETGKKIYNATRGGKLEVFERVEFDSLLGIGSV